MSMSPARKPGNNSLHNNAPFAAITQRELFFFAPGSSLSVPKILLGYFALGDFEAAARLLKVSSCKITTITTILLNW